MTNNVGLSFDIDPEKQSKAKELSKISRVFSISELIFSFIYFAFAIFSGFSVWLRDYGLTATDIWFFQLTLFCSIFFAIIEYIFYSHPSVERRVKFAENYDSQSK